MQATVEGRATYLVGIARYLPAQIAIKHRIKRVDRFLGNSKPLKERLFLYKAMSRCIIPKGKQPVILVDWSDLTADRSQQWLRAALKIKGRACVIYEAVYPLEQYGNPKVHETFMRALREVLPSDCRPIIVTDAGFRGTWFKLMNQLNFDWLGRIRNRDMVRENASSIWVYCKSLYTRATSKAQDLGVYEYVRRQGVACRLVLFKGTAKNRHDQGVMGKTAQNSRSKKIAAGHKEPWLLAVSPSLAHLNAVQVVKLYQGRMQIEESFRDTKNARWGLGIAQSQSKTVIRLSILLLIAALAIFALWVIGLTAKARGFEVQFGSKSKREKTVSVLTLAKWWLQEKPKKPTRREIDKALNTLQQWAAT